MPDCDVKVEDVQIPQWESSIPTLFQTTVNSEPDRNYLLPIYDGQALPGLGALRTAGHQDVKVGSFNATPGIVEQLKDPSSALKLDVGGQNEWWAYAAADQIFRVLSGTEPIENYHVGLRIFDETNADLIQGDDEFAWYESDGVHDRVPRAVGSELTAGVGAGAHAGPDAGRGRALQALQRSAGPQRRLADSCRG